MGKPSLGEIMILIDNKTGITKNFLSFRRKKHLKLKLLLEAVESRQELKLSLAVLAIVVLLQSPIGNPHMYSTSWNFWFFCPLSNLLSQEPSARKDLWSSH